MPELKLIRPSYFTWLKQQTTNPQAHPDAPQAQEGGEKCCLAGGRTRLGYSDNGEGEARLFFQQQ